MPDRTPFTTAPDADAIVALADTALGSLPQALLRHVDNLGISVEDLPDDETLDEMGLESAYALTGLYRGTPLHRRSVADPVRQPDMITLYRLPILLEWIEEGEDLSRLVRSVLIHEIAHHFGFSDAEIEALERESGPP